jgi:DNA-binding winged helix-turn-helix (wHTH) protein
MVQHRQIFFDQFRLDMIDQRLFRNEEEIRLRPKSLAVLQYLAERPNQIIGKRELLDTIWRDDPRGDDVLKDCIKEIRKALGDRKEQPRVIETRHGVGYRFIAPVTTSTNNRQDLHIASFHDLWTAGLSTETVLRALVQMDYESLAGLDETSEGTHNQWVQIANNNPDGYAFLLNALSEIIGYWHFEPVDAAVYEHLVSGDFEDSDLTVDKVQCLTAPGEYDAYFIIFAVKKLCRGFRANRLLYDAFLHRVEELHESGIVIRRICANAFTPEGVALCRSVGMKEIRPHNSHGLIFEIFLKKHRHFREGKQ